MTEKTVFKDGIKYSMPKKSISVAKQEDSFYIQLQIESDNPTTTVFHEYKDGVHTVEFRISKESAPYLIAAIAEQLEQQTI